MKPTLLLFCASILSANTITVITEPPAPDDYILQITTDLGISESGPDPWCCGPLSWSGTGILNVLVEYAQLGVIRGFGFIPCPATGDCLLTETVFSDAAKSKAPLTPEPSTFGLMLIALLCVAVLIAVKYFREKIRDGE